MNNKNHYFKEWKRFPTQHLRVSFTHARKICSKIMKIVKSSFLQRVNNKIASTQSGSRSLWSMTKIVSQNFCQSSFPPLTSYSDSSSTTPLSKANLFASVFASNFNLDDQGVQPYHFAPSKFTMSPIKFSTRKVRQTLVHLGISKAKGPDGIPAIVLKTCALELAPIRNKPFFSSSHPLSIYKSQIRPSLEYCCHVLGGGSKIHSLSSRQSPVQSHSSH